MTTIDPCKKFACKLQQCLNEIRRCCIVHKSVSKVCEGIDTSKKYEHKTVDYRTAQK
ncbi:uncharacterized protein LOC143151740 isoform X3 [Ptiloglossa arizonensis]|uniref:uncharacterized protein LOC143151740 isoform X3 n=1 Tax=Ptiloglossa arizonensis TaxID=3350558 RepID=UPI003F9F0A27